MRQTAARARTPLLVAVAVLLLTTAGLVVYVLSQRSARDGWTEQEIATLRSISLTALQPPPADPSNRFADNSAAAVFGQKLFFDVRLSGNDQVACATCHQEERSYTDGLAFSNGMGTTGRSAPSVLGGAYTRWLFWDGRKDSLWSQALGPMESPVEHGAARTRYVKVVAQFYKDEYEAIFGPLPADLLDEARFPSIAGPVPDPAAQAAWDAMSPADRDAVTEVYVNMGKAIAAYERQIQPGQARFDQYVQALLAGNEEQMRQAMSPEEVAGARLFIGKAECITCHTGPFLTDTIFHNINVPPVAGEQPDVGRMAGMQQVLEDEFNCLSKWSDATPEECGHLQSLSEISSAAMEGAFRTPTLRNIVDTAPYMHAGQFATLHEVMEHYNTGIPGEELNLSEQEIEQLVAFMRTLSGEIQKPPR